MALPRGLPQVSDTGKLLGALEYNVVDATKKLSATTATGTPATGLFHSTVVNRKSIPDITKDLGVRMGIERIPVQSIYQLQDEFGPNGEPVWAALNDDRGLIRFVGSNWSNTIGTYGQYPSTTGGLSEYVEITFFGTGLNLVMHQNYTGPRDFRVSVDGGSEGSNIVPASLSNVIGGRNYNMNQIVVAASGLTLGVHTVKVRSVVGADTFALYGFEVLNEQLLTTTANTNSNTSLTNVASTAGLKVGMDITGTGIPANTTITAISGSTITMSAAATATATGVTVRFGTNFIKVNPGTSYINGVAETLASQSTFAYNSDFESITRDGLPVVSLGSKGGRVVVYQKQDGSIAKAVTAVNTLQTNPASADHTYEEVIRTYHFREFGAGRLSPADDFSSLVSTTSDRFFTLDDGTTTLVCNQCQGSDPTGIEMRTLGTSFITITFVGTGLDVVRNDDAATINTTQVFVDGALQGTFPTSGYLNIRKIQKIVSGLPYGTHTVKLFQPSEAFLGRTRISQFIVYGPKKPALPAGAVELADYYLMADFNGSATTGTTVADNNVFPIGTIYKSQSREFVYSGANWNFSSPANFDVPSAANVWNPSNTQPVQYTFIGSEFQVHFVSSTAGTYDFSVTIDGSLNATGVARGNASNLTGGSYRMTDGSGNYARPGRIEFTGLSYGLHTVIVQKTAGAGSLNFAGLHIATKIHSPRSNLLADLQNTLPVGSCAISDNRVTTTSVNTNSIKPKAWAQAVGVASGPTTTSTIAIPMPDMSTTVKTSGGRVLISYSTSVNNSSANNTTRTAIYVNGILLNSEKTATSASNGSDETNSDTQIIFLPAGTHKIDVYWWCGGGTSMASGTRRNLIVAEL